MKRKKRIIRMLAAVLAASVLGSWGVPARAAGPAQVTVTVDGADVTPLAGARRVGANIEMSMISDAMWQANGNWMEQSFFAGELDMMRWGYDAWAFNWEQETPLSENRYWGGLNSRDAAGSFGLREFIRFCKQQDIVPFVMIPIESLDAFGGQAGLEKVKALTASMAQYIAQEGIELCYFDMGNEPWNNGAGGVANARYLGSLFPEFQQIVKAANPNYRLVLQRAPENILWNSWNSALVSAAQGAFDAYDDHRYAFYGWNKYFDKNSDALLEPGTPIEGKEGILGECNIGWTPVQDDWNAGHVRDMGGSMALLNAMLEMIGDGRYSRIVTWPSHYPSKASISGCPENAFGWFDLDQWYLEGKTVRLTGPAAAHRIVNQNVLENRLGASSSAEKVRVYAYCNAAQTDLRVIVLNKWDIVEGPEAKEKIRERIEDRMTFVGYAPVVAVCALTGKKVDRIWTLIDEAYANYAKTIPTAQLNNFLSGIRESGHTISKGKAILRMKYVTQTSTCPPQFTFFCNRPDIVDDNYERYLENRLRQAFDLTGTPIRLKFKKKD